MLCEVMRLYTHSYALFIDYYTNYLIMVLGWQTSSSISAHHMI